MHIQLLDVCEEHNKKARQYSAGSLHATTTQGRPASGMALYLMILQLILLAKHTKAGVFDRKAFALKPFYRLGNGVAFLKARKWRSVACDV